MSVVREDVWSSEDSEEVILERRVAYKTASQREHAVGCKGLTIWSFIVDFWCFNISSSEFNFLAARLYSSILVRLSACGGVSLVPSRRSI